MQKRSLVDSLIKRVDQIECSQTTKGKEKPNVVVKKN